MSEKPIPEKTSEMLFIRYLLQTFRLGEASIYAPSSREEFKNGYDSKLTGLSSFRELYLQFKAPRYSQKGRFTIDVTQHQHLMLKQYPVSTAYYVTDTFASLKDFIDAQREISIAEDFLRHFIAIEISPLPDDTAFFQYIKPASHRESPRVKYKQSSDGNGRTATHNIVGNGWLRGNQLVEKFKENSIGISVQLPSKNQDVSLRKALTLIDAALWQMTPEKALSIAEGCGNADFGIHLRNEMVASQQGV